MESLINFNADLLLYNSSKIITKAQMRQGNFTRNPVMFSNLNQIPVSGNDRIFILMGGTHTAFFMDFLKRSPKFKTVNTFEYLK